jgi:hypothetical protein
MFQLYSFSGLFFSAGRDSKTLVSLHYDDNSFPYMEEMTFSVCLHGHQGSSLPHMCILGYRGMYYLAFQFTKQEMCSESIFTMFSVTKWFLNIISHLECYSPIKNIDLVWRKMFSLKFPLLGKAIFFGLLYMC